MKHCWDDAAVELAQFQKNEVWTLPPTFLSLFYLPALSYIHFSSLPCLVYLSLVVIHLSLSSSFVIRTNETQDAPLLSYMFLRGTTVGLPASPFATPEINLPANVFPLVCLSLAPSPPLSCILCFTTMRKRRVGQYYMCRFNLLPHPPLPPPRTILSLPHLPFPLSLSLSPSLPHLPSLPFSNLLGDELPTSTGINTFMFLITRMQIVVQSSSR